MKTKKHYFPNILLKKIYLFRFLLDHKNRPNRCQHFRSGLFLLGSYCALNCQARLYDLIHAPIGSVDTCEYCDLGGYRREWLMPEEDLLYSLICLQLLLYEKLAFWGARRGSLDLHLSNSRTMLVSVMLSPGVNHFVNVSFGIVQRGKRRIEGEVARNHLSQVVHKLERPLKYCHTPAEK